MSSTGSVSKVSAAITIGGEISRQRQADIDTPDLEGQNKTVYGKITKVDKDQALVYVDSLYGDSKVANGRAIPINHSPREIAERWGKVKKGMIVLVQYTGPTGADASATIIKERGEDMVETKQEENSISQGLYRVFAPGIGIG